MLLMLGMLEGMSCSATTSTCWCCCCAGAQLCRQDMAARKRLQQGSAVCCSVQLAAGCVLALTMAQVAEGTWRDGGGARHVTG